MRQHYVERKQNGSGKLVVAKEGEHGSELAVTVAVTETVSYGLCFRFPGEGRENDGKGNSDPQTISLTRFYQPQHLPLPVLRNDTYPISPVGQCSCFDGQGVPCLPGFCFLCH